MSQIRVVYHDHEPRFPATDQHPDALRYTVGPYVVDAIDGEPTLAEIQAMFARQEPPSVAEAGAVILPPPSVTTNVTNVSMSSLELPLMQREADAVLAASVANPAATFARADYVLLATVIGRGVPATGDDSADIKAAAVHIHHEIKRASEALAQSIIQRQQVA
jgi:hypothetical protein